MKAGKNNNKKIIIGCFVIVIILVVIIACVNANKKTKESNSSTTTLIETQVSNQTIQKTLTGSGEITASSEEKLSLTTTKYFSTMCVEEGDSVAEGENILKYTNGTYLTAPYNLVVEEYSVPTTGSICTSSNYIKVKNTENLSMKLTVNESEISSIKVGQNATITVNAVENKTYVGTITKIDSVGTYSSSGSTFTATIEFENDGNVKIGMSASCTVVLEEEKDCIAVPISAIQTNGNTKYVVVVKDDGTTEDVTVETGISNDNYVQILSGLNGNETIKMLQTKSSSERSYSSSSSSSNGGMERSKGSMNGGSSRNSEGMQGGGGTPPTGDKKK